MSCPDREIWSQRGSFILISPDILACGLMTGDSADSSKAMNSASCTVFQDQFAEIQGVIDAYRSHKRENVAIIGLPYSGKSTLISAVHDTYKDDTYLVEYGSQITSKRNLLDYRSSKPIFLMDGCQYLFSRHIGGFSVLDDFLNDVVTSSSLFITTWNLYAWNYLRRIREVERIFPRTIFIPPLSDSEMRQCILQEYTDAELQFIGGVEVELPSFVQTKKVEVHLPFKKEPLKLPFPSFSFDRLAFRRRNHEEKLSDEDMVFKKITKMAEGNPGVGKAIWKRSFEYPTVNLKDYQPVRVNDPLIRKDAFILGVIAMTGVTSKEYLEEVAALEYDINPILYRLQTLGIITEKNDGYQICPEAIIGVHDLLRRLRIIWE